MKATTDKGAGNNECDITKDVRAQAGQEGVPRGETATSEVAEDTEAESTDTVSRYFSRMRRSRAGSRGSRTKETEERGGRNPSD